MLGGPGLTSPPLGKNSELVKNALAFANRIGDLLNRTVCNGVQMAAVYDEHSGECRIGYKMSKTDMDGQFVPLTCSGKQPTCWLGIRHYLLMDDHRTFLMDVRSSIGLYFDDAGEHELLRFDYVRDNPEHPEAHVHVGKVFHHDSSPERYHVPVGGRRFRPTLEDVVEFAIREDLAVGRPKWHEAVEEHRRHWFANQLRAAVRAFPELATEQLERAGYTVTPPVTS